MSNNIEIWKPIIGYEGVYEISSFGRIRSLDRITSYISRTQEGKEYTTTHTHKGKTLDGVLIKKYPSASDTGYCRESIRDCCNGRQKTAYGYKWGYLN